MDIRPYTIRIAEQRLEDLERRLQQARWFATEDADDWRDGSSLAFMQRLIRHWQSDFDWRQQEQRLNRLPQFEAQVDGLSIHFLHQRGTGPAPMPLVLTHGWPGSFVEMEKVLPLLTDPGAHGADPADSFHVVVPSLPGYGLSQAPQQEGFGSPKIADVWFKLMQGLGYHRFAAQGGDVGAGVSTWLARRFPQAVIGFHLNYISGGYRPWLGDGAPAISPDEQAFLDRAAAWYLEEGGYAHMHSTKPQTLAYALNDSPVGLAAWIIEKFRAWSDCDGDVERAFTLDELLTDVSLYWFSGTVDATLRVYKANRLDPLHFGAGERVQPPLGVALFPRELPMPPRSWVERSHHVARWTTMPRGGHFAAMEQPALLAEDIRAFFRPLRQQQGIGREGD